MTAEVVVGEAAAGLVGRALGCFPEEISYVRAEVGRARVRLADPASALADGDWLSCGSLIGDPARLAAVIEACGHRLGTGDPMVAASLFVQGYAYRVLMVAIACTTVSGVVPDSAAGSMAITVARGRPQVVAYLVPRALVVQGLLQRGGERRRQPSAAIDHAVDFLLAQAVGAHLAPLIDATRSGFRVGARLLWGNVAASAAVAFRTMDGCLGPWVQPVGERFFERAPGELKGQGGFLALEHGGRRGWYWERTNCCLYDRLPGNIRCADCSRTPEAERRAAYLASLCPRPTEAPTADERC